MKEIPKDKAAFLPRASTPGVADIYTILNSLPDIVVIADTSGRILFLNRRARQFEYVQLRQVSIGDLIFDHLPGGWSTVGRKLLENLNDDGRQVTLEAHYQGKQGKNTFEIACNAIRDETGKVSQIFIDARDVTPQKIFEQKITLFAREYQDLIENANAVIFGVDSRGYITEWNDKASQVTGYEKNQAYTQPILKLLFAEEKRESFSRFMESVMRGDTVTNLEVDIIASGQRHLSFLLNATPRRNAESAVIGVLFIGQDVTELTAYRKSLEQKVHERTDALQASLQKEKELVQIKNRFVAIASHEFKHPLSGIVSHVSFLKKNIRGISWSDALEKLEKIQTEVTHMTVLLEDVLTIGKTEAGNLKANIGPIELRAFFQGIIDEVEHQVNHSHKIYLDFPEGRLDVSTDEKLLRNIFINLLNNAIKYSPGKKEVRLKVSASPTAVEIHVEDKGIGIAAEDMDSVFEPFTRGSNTGEIRGTGLGLSIVKKAVATLGGNLQVSSRPGEGTVFTVKLNR